MADEPHILLVDDERDIRDPLASYLGKNGMRVTKAADAAAAREILAVHAIDLVLLDIMMPGEDGLSLAGFIRATTTIPVILLTAKAEEMDRIIGLEIGTDDYVTKPFSPRELLARINAVLRRSAPGIAGESLEAGGLVLDVASHRVTVDDQNVALGPTEYRLLQFFMEHPERVYSRSQLLDRVWGGNVYVEERTVDVHIRRLRKALEPSGRDGLVQTVRGSGYRFSTRPE